MIEKKLSSEFVYNFANADPQKKSLDGEYRISGYASVFDVKDSQSDVVKKGAFIKTIKDLSYGKVIPMLWQHMHDKPIGVIEKMEEDEYGLYIVGKIISNIRYGVEALELIKSKVICSFSIGYNLLDYFMDYTNDKRIIKEIDLWEVSVVTFPANQYSSITSYYDSV